MLPDIEQVKSPASAPDSVQENEFAVSESVSANCPMLAELPSATD